MPTKRRKVRKSRRSCKNGKRVRTKKGSKKMRSRKRKSRKRKYRMNTKNCKLLEKNEKCKDDIDIITLENIDYDNKWMNYYRFVDDGTCMSKDNWRRYNKLDNPANRQPAVCDPEHDLNPQKVSQYARNDNWPKV